MTKLDVLILDFGRSRYFLIKELGGKDNGSVLTYHASGPAFVP